MQKLAIYAGLAAISSVVAFGTGAGAALPQKDGGSISSTGSVIETARKGADDRNGNERHGRGRGRDDGANHAENATGLLQVARNGGSDGHSGGGHDGGGHDGSGHDGGGHEGHGRGSDDNAGHDDHARGADDGAGHIRHAHGADDAAGDDHGGQRG